MQSFTCVHFYNVHTWTLGDAPPCIQEQLPVSGNGSVTCVQRGPNDLKCTLTCKDMFKFGSSADFSPQYCRDGVWDYQKDQVEIPNCQREHIYCETMMFQLSIILLYFKPGPSIAFVLFILHDDDDDDDDDTSHLGAFHIPSPARKSVFGTSGKCFMNFLQKLAQM